jgi:hypothetical protein
MVRYSVCLSLRWFNICLSVVVLYLTIILVALHLSKGCHSSVYFCDDTLLSISLVDEVLQRMSAVTRRGDKQSVIRFDY